MATLIEKTSTNYNVSNESATLKMNGTCLYSDRIESMNLQVYGVDSNFIGNMFYQEFEDENSTVNYTVPMRYMIDCFNLLQSIINDIKAELVE